MSCHIKSDSTPQKNDIHNTNRDGENDNKDHFLSEILKRKDGKCNSPTSSKESHSDRDSDLEESNSEFHGRRQIISDVDLKWMFRLFTQPRTVKTIYF